MAAILNINTDALVALTNKLEKLHRSDLPIAIRNTLTNAAKLTKTQSLLKITNETFTNRNKSFFKAKSRFEAAKGFNIRQMKATVGMIDLRRNSGDHAVRNLEEQERGGTIGGRSFIPRDTAREGGNNAAKVMTRNRISKININNIVRITRSRGKNAKQRFIKSALFAKSKFRTKAFVLRRNILFRIDAFSLSKRTGKLRLKLTPIYSFRKGRSVKISATGFMKRSTLIQAKKLDILFKKEAEKRFKKAKI